MKLISAGRTGLLALGMLCLVVMPCTRVQAAGAAPGSGSNIAGMSSGAYVAPTVKNLSKLYWALAMFDLSSNQAVDNFLIINDCDLYKKYYSSDFEFESLRAATRASIQKNLASFPTKFEIMIPIGLGRYNTETERFSVDDRSRFLSAKRLEIAADIPPDSGRGCLDYSADLEKYSQNFILSLSRPFTLTEVPVSPEVAQFYIEQSQKELPYHPTRNSISKFGRLAFICLDVTLTQFRGYESTTAQSGLLADIFGNIDRFAIYADRAKTLLLFDGHTKVRNLRSDAKRSLVLPDNKNGQLLQSGAQGGGANTNAAAQGGTMISPETGAVEKGLPIPAVPPASAPATNQKTGGQ